jgi:predicted short-subunit dehydrogenase-like oxidoreductase (DUF2520 family)
MNITIIGSGNVATVLAKLIIANGHTIVNIAARNVTAGNELAKTVHAKYCSIENLNPAVDIIILAVADNAIAEMVMHIKPSNVIVVHTAGSVSINVLGHKFENYGVMYPLQSLRKDMIAIPTIPLLLEANNPDTYKVLENFCKTLSNTVSPITENERLHLHTAAVIVNNFTNYLYAEAYQLCQANTINFDLLQPLIQETANRVAHKSPLEMQTGPAKRNDTATIEKHLQVLEKNVELQSLYKFISDRIIQAYKNPIS